MNGTIRRVRSFSDAEPPLAPRSHTTVPYYADKPRPLSLGRTLTDQFRSEQLRLDRPRLPDRNSLKIDVFGRRRCVPDNGGDFSATTPQHINTTSYSLPRPNLRPEAQSLDDDTYAVSSRTSTTTTFSFSSVAPYEDEDPIAFGPLATSMNMNNALDKTLRSKDGTIKRKHFKHRQPLIDKKQMAAAVNGTPTNSNSNNSSREIKSAVKNSNKHPAINRQTLPTFCTTMSAKQAAATLETTCRDMSCRVKRVPITNTSITDNNTCLAAGLGAKVKLKISRPGPRFGAPNQRRCKAYIVIHEHDKLRTDIYLLKSPGGFGIFDNAAFNALSDDIRWRFQREWPLLVDALYVRAPA